MSDSRLELCQPRPSDVAVRWMASMVAELDRPTRRWPAELAKADSDPFESQYPAPCTPAPPASTNRRTTSARSAGSARWVASS